MGFRGISKSLIDISGNLILIEINGIPMLVELGRFLGYMDISGNFRLVGLSRFSRFCFRIWAASHKAFLLVTRDSK